MSAKIILVEGPDNSGKTTLINKLLEDKKYKLINFPKKIFGERFVIESPNDKAIFETLLAHLDPKFTYILDRGYLSNIIYSGYIRNTLPSVSRAMFEYEDFLVNFNVKEVVLIRNKLDVDFEDDLISLDQVTFNRIINLYSYLSNNTFKVLNHDGCNNVLSVDEDEYTRLMEYIND